MSKEQSQEIPKQAQFRQNEQKNKSQLNQNELEDKDLIARFRNEESRNYAFNLLVRKYQERLYHHIRNMVIDHDDTDDLLQEVFIKVWKGLVNFREEAQLFTWLYRIASNECLTFLEKKKRKFLLPIHDVKKELAQKLNTYISSKSMYFSGEEIEVKLQKVLLTLPDKQRLVFNMKYFDDMTYEEMSAVLGTSVGALKASYHHAVKKIEEQLSQEL
ncbi:RNA polymerase sigma-70 factor, ECF subfamily [Thermoflexibacter ruber]|uniref:RNA polymerase sigma factor n=1 Tax=Thermoflexibacter ruber TaxID=1003 RepID=A0A1I2HBI8_9BACT|nr:RNA polymerase sigma-70 factor, ECF subfamily [Thermoflexibacter ruber]